MTEKIESTLGYIADPFGEVCHKVKTGASGNTTAINNMCIVTRGEALIRIGSKQ